MVVNDYETCHSTPQFEKIFLWQSMKLEQKD